MVWLPAEYREVSEMKKHLIFWAAALLFQLASTASDVQNAVQPYLLPLPREYTQSEKFVSGTAHIYFEDNWGISAGTADFLKREFQWALNAVFTQKRNNGDFRLVLKKCPASELPSNPEAYTLAIDAERNIILKAANRSGMFRAIGRLLCIIALPPVSRDGNGTIHLPVLTITDAPHFPFRAVTFNTNLGRPYSAEQEAQIRRELDIAAKLGYNHVWLAFGGRWESRRHPEFTRHPAWPVKSVQALIQYAEDRGLRALPATNSIGHVKAAPRLPVIGGKSFYRGKMVHFDELIMDLSHPDFYKLWFDYLDEYCSLFKHPEYCSIGTDEFHRGLSLLEQKMGRKYEDFYPEFVNKTARFLLKKNIRTTIYHDMLASQKCYRKGELYYEEANGSRDIIDKIDPEVLIEYWSYIPSLKYPLLEKIRKSGHDICVTFWTNPDNVRRLTQLTDRMGITKVCSGLFGLRGNETGLVLNAEYFWNPKPAVERTHHFHQACSNRLFALGNYAFSQQPEMLPGVTDIPLPDFLKNRFEKCFSKPQNNICYLTGKLSAPVYFGLSKPLRKIPEQELLAGTNPHIIMVPEDSMEYVPLGRYRVNPPVRRKGFSIYTCKQGKTTGTNRFGHEFPVRNGILQAGRFSFSAAEQQGGNMAIPDQGYVVSSHHVLMEREAHPADFMQSLRPGRRITFYELPEKIETKTVSLALPEKAILFFWMPLPVEKRRGNFLKDPVVIEFSLGKNKFRLTGGDMFYHNRTSQNGWKIWNVSPDSMTNFVFAVETPVNTGKAKLQIKVLPGGRIAGLTLLGMSKATRTELQK